MGKFFKLSKRCPYCARRLNKIGQCKNPNCIIGYVPDKRSASQSSSMGSMDSMGDKNKDEV